MIRVYFSSQLKHAQKWRDICDDSMDIICTARWVKHALGGTPDDDPREAEMFWAQDEQDVRDADVVIVYAEPNDRLRGALVEAGMALSLGVPVIVVGQHHDYGTWQHHPGVRNAPTLEDALRVASLACSRYDTQRRLRPPVWSRRPAPLVTRGDKGR
jgi:nucleoside 2-deoxyribosyltransferase